MTVCVYFYRRIVCDGDGPRCLMLLMPRWEEGMQQPETIARLPRPRVRFTDRALAPSRGRKLNGRKVTRNEV